MTSIAERNAALVGARTKLTPRVGIVLGSGLGDFSKSVEDAVAIPFGDLQGFPAPSVSGHAGTLSYELLCALAQRVPVLEAP